MLYFSHKGIYYSVAYGYIGKTFNVVEMNDLSAVKLKTLKLSEIIRIFDTRNDEAGQKTLKDKWSSLSSWEQGSIASILKKAYESNNNNALTEKEIANILELKNIDFSLNEINSLLDELKIDKIDDFIKIVKELGKENLDETKINNIVKNLNKGKNVDEIIKWASKAELGHDFGEMGKYVEHPNIEVDWSKFAEHGLERMEQRGVTKDMVNDFVRNGKVLSQNEGNKFAFITKDGVAVVSKDGKLITTWGKDKFDDNMKEIVKMLWGEW